MSQPTQTFWLSNWQVSLLKSPGVQVVPRGPAPPLKMLAVTWVLHSMHSSVPHGRRVSLSGEVSIMPLPLLSMQSALLAATLVTQPVLRLDTTTKRPVMLTEVRDGLELPFCVRSE